MTPARCSGSPAPRSGPCAPGSTSRAPTRTRPSRRLIKAIAGEVEDDHGVPIEVVCVGDTALDDRLGAALQAAREAMVNAAKYAEAPSVSVYAEVSGDEIAIFVRDRGKGFDLDRVPADRMGVRGSIIGRMERNGGKASVRTGPGEGTEVRLEISKS